MRAAFLGFITPMKFREEIMFTSIEVGGSMGVLERLFSLMEGRG